MPTLLHLAPVNTEELWLYSEPLPDEQATYLISKGQSDKLFSAVCIKDLSLLVTTLIREGRNVE